MTDQTLAKFEEFNHRLMRDFKQKFSTYIPTPTELNEWLSNQIKSYIDAFTEAEAKELLCEFQHDLVISAMQSALLKFLL